MTYLFGLNIALSYQYFVTITQLANSWKYNITSEIVQLTQEGGIL